MRRGGRTERAAVRDITASCERIRDFLSLLSRNTVTPCTLREVVEDALSRGTKDYNKFRNAIRDALGDYIWKKNKRRPMILPIIMEEES